MKRLWFLLTVIVSIGLIAYGKAKADPPYIFGMHDAGGEHHMIEKGKPGWVLVTEAVGRNPNDYSSADYSYLSNQGLGVLVRLNHGYGTDGTIPYSKHYSDFAKRCGNFVQASGGCHIWIVGNEMNLSGERPRYEGWEEVITISRYIDCFTQVRNEIRSRPGHENDQVVIGAVGPWNTETDDGDPGTSPHGDWIDYFVAILNGLGADGLDGIALHTYTHGTDPDYVFSNAKMSPPYQDRYWHFKAYRDFMNAIPAEFRDLPVYITETDQVQAWADVNSGWVKNAYYEINSWNTTTGNQKIRSLCLYRWQPWDQWVISTKQGVINDWRDAMNNDYRWAIGEGNVAGFVRDANDNPLAGATVRLTPDDYNDTTGADGSYFISDVPVGVYSVSASLSGYGTQNFYNQEVKDGQTTNIDFTLSPISYTLINPDFELTDTTPDGTPIGWTIWGQVDGVQESGAWFGEIPAYSGNYFLGTAACWGTKNGGIYQQVGVMPNTEYNVKCWYYIYWGGGSYTSRECWLGIDPTGGVNSYSPVISWAGPGTEPNDWGGGTWHKLELKHIDTGSSTTVTVFLKHVQKTTENWNINCFDAVDLSLTTDLDYDGTVNLSDFGVLAKYWLRSGPEADISPPGGNGVVDFFDLARLIEDWLKTGP